MTNKLSLRPRPAKPNQPSKISRKIRKHKSKASPETAQENQYTQLTSSIVPSDGVSMVDRTWSKGNMVGLLRNLVHWLRFGQDTYLVGLRLLGQIKFKIPQQLAHLYCAAIILLAAKVHEYRTPKFSDMLFWGSQTFSFADLENKQAELLIYFDFKVPVVLGCTSTKEVEGAVLAYEGAFTSMEYFQ